jgi:hypothetical protein
MCLFLFGFVCKHHYICIFVLYQAPTLSPSLPCVSVLVILNCPFHDFAFKLHRKNDKKATQSSASYVSLYVNISIGNSSYV